MHALMLSHVQLFVTPWTVAHQAPLSIGFSRQEHWSRLPFPPPRDLPNPGIEHVSPASPAAACGFFTTEPPGKPYKVHWHTSSNNQSKITYFLHVLHRNIPFLPTSSMLVSATSEMASTEVEKMKASF